MERIIRNTLIVTSLLIASLVAITPLTSYALEGEKTVQDDKTLPVNLNIISILELDVVSPVSVKAQPDKIVPGTISANVRSSHGYTISLSAEQPNLMSEKGTASFIPASSNLTPGQDGWGVKVNGAENYTEVTTEPQVFYTGQPDLSGRKTDLEVGVATSPALPADVYATTVTVTAASGQ